MAVTAPIGMLIKGVRRLTISSGRYKLAAGFVLPDVQLVPLISAGTSANRNDGGDKVSETAVNRRWEFGVHIQNCASAAEVKQAANDLRNFLLDAGDDEEPLYLYFKDQSNISADPLWGQEPLFYEIVQGGFKLSDMYMVSDLRSRALPTCPVRLEIKPWALGLKQRLASATGGIVLNRLGVTDGRDQGPILTVGITNLVPNPVFGHSTYDTGWTNDGNLVVSKNTDKAHILPDATASVKITSKAASNNVYYITINLTAAGHFLWAIIELADGGTPTSADMQLWYGSAQTTTFTSLGNGLWRAEANITGTGSNASCGVQVKAGRSINLLFMQITLGADARARIVPCWGDLLGHSWGGTPHNSTSTRVAGRIRLPVDATNFSLPQGTLILAVKFQLVPTSYGTDAFVFSCGSSSLRAWLESSDEKFYLNDGTNEIGSGGAVQAFAAGTVVWLAFVWGPAGLAIYVNGALYTSGAIYTPPNPPSYVYFGSDSSAANQIGGPFIGSPRIYGKALAAAEILADYADKVQVTNDGQRVGSLPWEWTQDGDDVIDAYYDGTAVNMFVCGGIPGSAPAKTSLKLTASGGFSSLRSFWMGVLATERHIPPGTFFENQAGTSTSSADVGSNAQTVSQSTAYGSSIAMNIPDRFYRLFQGQEVYLFVRLSDAGSGLSISQWLLYTGGGVQVMDAGVISVAADASRRLFKTRPLVFKRQKQVFGAEPDATVTNAIALGMVRASGTANVVVDYILLLPAPLTQIDFPNTTSETIALVEGMEAQVLTTVNEIMEELAYVYGEPLELKPELLNHVVCAIGSPSASSAIADSVTLTKLFVTPRYALLS